MVLRWKGSCSCTHSVLFLLYNNCITAAFQEKTRLVLTWRPETGSKMVPRGAIVPLQTKELPHVVVLALFHVPSLNTVIVRQHCPDYWQSVLGVTARSPGVHLLCRCV